ncbi:MAG: universal stress protein [Halobacteriaceae archaeon]
MYESILFPTDGSEGAAGAFDHAIDLAATFDASLSVLFVADTSRESVTMVEGEVVDALEAEGEEAIADLVDRAQGRGVEAAGEVVQGPPYRTILDYAETRDVDVIVMPTHGREGLDRYLLGSVTERVVRTSSVPVLTVHRED